MTLPNFLIVGAAKAGTTSLYYYLDQHPEIYMSPIKEPRFFAPEFYTTHSKGLVRSPWESSPLTIQDYQKLFEEVDEEKAIGEASTEYLYFEKTPQRIKQLVPETRIVAILRNPIERAYSAYCYQLRDGCEILSFKEALEQEESRKSQGWRPGWLYRESSLYYIQLKRYLDHFSPQKVKVCLHEDLKQNTKETVSDIYTFLGVDPHFTFDTTNKNVSFVPKYARLNRFLKRNPIVQVAGTMLIPDALRAAITGKLRASASKPKKLSPKLKAEMVEFFSSDIQRVENLINRDLSHWLLP